MEAAEQGLDDKSGLEALMEHDLCSSRSWQCPAWQDGAQGRSVLFNSQDGYWPWFSPQRLRMGD